MHADHPSARSLSPRTRNVDPALRKKFATELTRLGLRYVQWLVAERQISVAAIPDALTRRVNIYRLTRLWNGQDDPALGHRDFHWSTLTAQLAAWIRNAPTEELEAQAVEVLEPLLSDQPEPLPQPSFGCWSYEVVGEGIADGPGVWGRVANGRKLWHKARALLGAPLPRRHAELHFYNAVSPRSPFADRETLLNSLADLAVDCRRHHSSVEWLWCSSWLNSREDFLSLFPDAWRNSATERTQRNADASSFGRARLNTDNWWGQFERRDGSFHAEMARRFEDSGYVFPYPNRRCCVRLSALESHLADRRTSSRC